MMKTFYLIILLLCCIRCGTVYVQHDYDKEVDFSQYKTYQFDLDHSGGLSELDERRLLKYTDSILKSKGLQAASSPDLFIAYQAETYESNSGNSLGVGVGGTGGNVGVGVSGGIPIGGRSIHQRLILSVTDASKNTLIWEADSDSRIKEKTTPEQRDRYYKTVVEKIFKKFLL